MKKVLIVGCNSESEQAREILANKALQKDEIVFIEKPTDLPLSDIDNFEQIIQLSEPNIQKPKELVFNFHNYHKIDPIFAPRTKHCHKGHERPYKFHR